MTTRDNKPRYRYSMPSATNGDLKTPVVFGALVTQKGLDRRGEGFKELFKTFAQIYSPSFKDIEIGKDSSTKAEITLKIRDPLTTYYPDNRHVVQIEDHRYGDKTWQVVNVRPDFDNRDFLVVVLARYKND